MRGRGLQVPPIIIFSVTNRCNLKCKGCYAQAIREESSDVLSPSKMREIIGEAEDLGVSFFIIAGGEPLMRPEIMDITREFPGVLFLMATNGLLLDSDKIKQLASRRNTIPALSIEGTQMETDERRGAGVHKRLESKMAELKKEGVFFSVSITMTRSNFDIVTDEKFIDNAIKSGCGFFLFLEYTPIRKETEDWVITEKQRNDMKDVLGSLKKRFKAVFIGVPWDEEESGGCLASGRGFVHINASGDLEPCPLAPFSDTNLLDKSLTEALQSVFIKKLRDNHGLLAETRDGCALWKNREWVNGLLKSAAAEDK